MWAELVDWIIVSSSVWNIMRWKILNNRVNPFKMQKKLYSNNSNFKSLLKENL